MILSTLPSTFESGVVAFGDDDVVEQCALPCRRRRRSSFVVRRRGVRSCVSRKKSGCCWPGDAWRRKTKASGDDPPLCDIARHSRQNIFLGYEFQLRIKYVSRSMHRLSVASLAIFSLDDDVSRVCAPPTSPNIIMATTFLRRRPTTLQLKQKARRHRKWGRRHRKKGTTTTTTTTTILFIERRGKNLFSIVLFFYQQQPYSRYCC